MKRICAFWAAVLIAVSICPITPAYAAEVQPLPFEVQTQGLYMENLETGQVMAEKNPDAPFAPASLAKIMTAILTLENVEDTENTLATLRSSVNHTLVGTGAKVGGIWPGDQISVKDLLYDIMLFSGADAALMLADYVSDGSVAHFVKMMNERAQELGCTGTLFKDPHGLDETQYTTAHDMAIMTKHALTLPGFADIVATAEYNVTVVNRATSFPIYTTNSMMRSNTSYYYSAVKGIKTGTITSESTLVSLAKKDGYSYLLVQLGVPRYNPDGTPTDPAQLNFAEATQLYDWVLSNFSIRTAVEKGEERVEVPVKYSFQSDFVRLATAEQFTALLHKNIDVSSILYVPDIPEYLVAPVEKGTEIGTLKLIYMEEEIGRVPLVTTASLPQSELLATLGKIQNEIHTFRMKFVIIFTVLIVSLYAALIVRAQNLRKRSGKYSSYRNGEDKGYHM